MRIDKAKLAYETTKREWRDKLLANRAGISRATLSAIKGGKSVTPDTFNKIVAALGVDPADILVEDA